MCARLGPLGEQTLFVALVLRKRLDYPDLRGAVKQQASLYAAKNIVIEGRASGTQLLQDLREDGVHGATGYETQMDKIMRMHSVSSTIENDLSTSPRKPRWLQDTIHLQISASPESEKYTRFE